MEESLEGQFLALFRSFCFVRSPVALDANLLRASVGSLPSPGEAEITSVSRLLDDRARLSDFEQFVRAMYRVPGFVIPYP